MQLSSPRRLLKRSNATLSEHMHSSSNNALSTFKTPYPHPKYPSAMRRTKQIRFASSTHPDMSFVYDKRSGERDAEMLAWLADLIGKTWTNTADARDVVDILTIFVHISVFGTNPNQTIREYLANSPVTVCGDINAITDFPFHWLVRDIGDWYHGVPSAFVNTHTHTHTDYFLPSAFVNTDIRTDDVLTPFIL